MHDYYLRSDTQTTMSDALIEAGLISVYVHQDGKTERYTMPGVTVDHIGPLAWLVYEDGEIIAKSDSRWHTNVRTVDPLTDEQVAVLPFVEPAPTNPVRRFFDAVPSPEPTPDPTVGVPNDDGP